MDLSKIENLLIIRLSSLGDVLLTTPLIRSIKKNFSNINIDFLVNEEYKDAVLFNPHLSNVYTYNKKLSTTKNIELNNLKSKKYGLVLDLQNNLRSLAITLKIMSPVKRFKKKTFAKFLLVNFKINLLKDAPEIPLRYAQTIKGFELDDEGLELYIPENVSSKLNDEKSYVGFAPGSKHFTKMWPKNYFINLGNYFVKSGQTVVLFGGKDDENVCKEISSEIKNSINLCNNNNLLETASEMKKCTGLICNDSGLMHIGCAVGIPVVAIFGSTVSYFGFTPYKNKSIVVENENISCRPCSHIGKSSCPKKHFKCMNEITPLMVFNKFKYLKEYR